MSSKSKKLTVAADILGENIEGVIRKIPLTQILPTTGQPRKNTEINIDKLSMSLQAEGLLQPIVVTKSNSNEYRIIAGERRYRAAKLAGWPDIECKILNKEENDTFRLAVIENIQRENLDAIEEANAYLKLKTGYSYTDQELAEILGKSRNYVSEILSIASIPEIYKDIATDIGINSRNLLVQYAQAIKNEKGDEFIENFKKGAIQSVKSAKNYIKQIKTNKLDDQQEPITQKNNTHNGSDNQKTEHLSDFYVQIKSKWKNENQIAINVDIQNISDLTLPLADLDKKISDSVKEILENL